MAQYDILLTQNVAASGIQFQEKFVNIAKGGLLSANAASTPTVLAAGTNGYILQRDDLEVTGLKWVDPGIFGGGTSNVSVTNQANNRVVTATATTDVLNAESGLTYDGSYLSVTGIVLSNNIAELTAGVGVTIDGVLLKDSYVRLTDITAPGTPAAGYGYLYVNADKIYFKNDAGVAYDLTATGGASVWTRSGTNLSPTTSGDDILFPSGDKIQWIDSGSYISFTEVVAEHNFYVYIDTVEVINAVSNEVRMLTDSTRFGSVPSTRILSNTLGTQFDHYSTSLTGTGQYMKVIAGASSNTLGSSYGGSTYILGGNQTGVGGGHGGNVYIYGGSSVSSTRGGIYFGDGVSIASLPAKGSETNVVYYDTATGKLSYGTVAGGSDPVDSTLLDWSTDRYQPYAASQAGALYTGTTNPSHTTRLNYGGYLYATKLYSGAYEAVTVSAGGSGSSGFIAVWYGSTSLFTETGLYLSGAGDARQLILPVTLRTKGSTTGSAPIYMPPGAAPTTPAAGDIWMNNEGLVVYSTNNGTMQLVGTTHVHGDISSAGAITSTAVTPAVGDYLLLSDNSNGGVIKRGVAIGSGTTTFLRNDGTWATPAGGSGMIYPGAGIVVSTGSAWGTSIVNNSANWDTAYSWGDHASAGYQPGHLNLTSLAALVHSSTSFVKMTAPGTFALDTNAYSLTSHAHAESAITFTDITTNNATTSKHGYLPKLSGSTSKFLRGDGTWVPVVTVTDHGALSGLTDDDHTQYYNQTRGDARYSLTGHTHLNYAPLNVLISSKTTAYTVQSSDNNKIIECSGTFTVTLPDGMTTGFQVTIVNVSTGTITIAATTTLYSKNSNTKLASRWIGATAYHQGSNVWILMGDLTA